MAVNRVYSLNRLKQRYDKASAYYAARVTFFMGSIVALMAMIFFFNMMVYSGFVVKDSIPGRWIIWTLIFSFPFLFYPAAYYLYIYNVLERKRRNFLEMRKLYLKSLKVLKSDDVNPD